MSLLIAAPDTLAGAAADVASLGSSLRAAHDAAAGSTTSIVTAAEDEVSAAIARLFSAHGQWFHGLGAQAAAFQDQFVQALTASAGSYASTEAQSVGTLVGDLFAATPISPSSTGNPTFSGTASLLGQAETELLARPLNSLLTVSGFYNQLGTLNSASIAHLMSGYGQEYQALAGQAAAFQEQFVQNLTASTGSFTSAEAANTALLQPLDPKVSYYATAGLALAAMIVTFSIAPVLLAAIPILGWAFLPLVPFLFLGNLATWFSLVSTGQPIPLIWW
jgi:hypothetical protein